MVVRVRKTLAALRIFARVQLVFRRPPGVALQQSCQRCSWSRRGLRVADFAGRQPSPRRIIGETAVARTVNAPSRNNPRLLIECLVSIIHPSVSSVFTWNFLLYASPFARKKVERTS